MSRPFDLIPQLRPIADNSMLRLTIAPVTILHLDALLWRFLGEMETIFRAERRGLRIINWGRPTAALPCGGGPLVWADPQNPRNSQFTTVPYLMHYYLLGLWSLEKNVTVYRTL